MSKEDVATVTEPELLRASRMELAHFDTNRELYERRDKVHQLTRLGLSAEEISREIGLSGRNVERHRVKPPAPQRPHLYDASGVSDERARQLEQTAVLVLQLAAVLRDEDPALVWGSLIRLGERRLREFAVIALAAIPVDMSRDQLLSWVLDLPAARA
ncbi:DUF7368 family protein [Mycobacterium kansasii]